MATARRYRYLPSGATCDALRVAALGYAASRLALLLVGWLTVSFIAVRGTATHGVKTGLGTTLEHLTCNWDCAWYLSIAGWGYTPGSQPTELYATNLAFWPALPYLARYFHELSGFSILTAGVIITNVCFFFALLLLYKYCTTLDLERRSASFAVMLLAFVPESFLFSAFYGDALALLGMLGAMYYARTARWWLASLFAILASSSRPTGILVIVFLVVYAYQQLGWRNFLRPWIDARPFIPVVLAPAGHFLTMWMAFRASGDAFAEVHTRAEGAGWLVGFAPPWASILGDFRGYPDLKFWAIAALLMAISLIPLLCKRWWPDAIFGLCYFLLIFSQHNPEGLLHYAIGLPVVYVGFALLCRHSTSGRHALLGAFASVGAVLCCAWALQIGISV